MKHLFEQVLNEILAEEEIADATVFTPEQQKFLGKFAQKGSTSLGILYSKSPEGIAEFVLRSGTGLELTPDVFNQLLKTGIISIVNYGTFRNPQYTIQLDIPLSDVAGFVQQDGAAEAPADGAAPAPSSSGGGGGMTTADLESPPIGGEEGGEIPEIPGAEGEVPGEAGETLPETPEEAPEEEIPATGPEESFRKDGELIMENQQLNIYRYESILEQTAKTLKQIISDKKRKPKVYSSKSRVLKRLPSGYIYYLEKIFELMSIRLKTDTEKEHLVADLMDNLAHNFGLTPHQILRSYVYYKNQNKLRNILKK
jgi:hypothetical protein